MCKEADSKGKNGHVTPDLENEAVQSREQSGGKSVDQSGEPDVQFVAPPPASRGQGLSFRVLQWLTDTADDTDPDDNVESRSRTVSIATTTLLGIRFLTLHI